MASTQLINQEANQEQIFLDNSKEEQISKKKILKACIVIPTYNEAKNIVSLIDEIFFHEGYYRSENKDLRLDVLVVDDKSPDKTYEVVKRYSTKNDRVHLLLRKNKEGLGKAYIAGMKHAIETLNPDVIFEMDADHSHDPKDIFRMIDEINNGYDFVIGSRYVDGGQVPQNWGWHRKVISYLAGTISKVGLGLYGVKDCSGGFRAIKREVFDKVDLDSLNVRGYAFQVVLLEEVLHYEFSVKEIPISFEQRKDGVSKMRLNDMMEGWTAIFKVRSKRLLGRISLLLGYSKNKNHN
ncbi:MAG: polyprenol monophosphomannose synthase [Nanoarchaeota archaeon]|nr:polyprenol monophosphomannose synthase [Nanoarchaeota archaeon]